MRAGTAPAAVLLGGSINALWVARSLARAGIEVHALADGVSSSPVRHSRAAASVLQVDDPSTTEERWVSWLETAAPAVVLPCGDHGVEMIARQRARLLELGHHPVEADDEVATALLDKQRTYDLAAAAGIEVPRTLPIADLGAAREAADAIGFPCALKPVASHRFGPRFRRKAFVVRDAGQLEAAFAWVAASGLELLLTEIIPGHDDSYCSYYAYVDDAGHPLVELTKHKLRQWPVGFGLGTLHRTGWVADAAEVGRRFFAAVGLRGIGNVEFKRDARDGRLKLIECNPRLTAADELLRRAGVDLAAVAYARALGRTPEVAPAFAEGLRQWHPLDDTLAFLALRRQGLLSTVEWWRDLRSEPLLVPLLDLRDPLPSLANAAGLPARARRAASRVTRSTPAGTAARRLLAQADLLPDLGARDGVRHWRTRHGRAHAHLEAIRDRLHAEAFTSAAAGLGAAAVDVGGGAVRIRRGATTVTVRREDLGLDPQLAVRRVQDRAWARHRLLEAGLPVPEAVHVDAEDLSPALAQVARAHGSWVVKPAAGTGAGIGVTCGVRSADDLRRAARRAAAWCPRLIVERMLPGDDYRVLVLDGELLGAVRRRRPRIVGDGRSTIGGLIHAENRRRLRPEGGLATFLLRIDLDCILTLRAAGLRLGSVPRAGEEVVVKTACNQNSAREQEVVTALSAELVAEAVTAAGAVGLRLAGVDIVTPGIGASLWACGGGVIEVNANPGLHHHMLVSSPGDAADIAVPVLAALLGDGALDARAPAARAAL